MPHPHLRPECDCPDHNEPQPQGWVYPMPLALSVAKGGLVACTTGTAGTLDKRKRVKQRKRAECVP